MDTKDAGRKGGLSRSEKKRAASSRNLARARATMRAAIEAWKITIKKADAARDAFHAVPAGTVNHKELVAWQNAADAEVKACKKLETFLPTLLPAQNGGK